MSYTRGPNASPQTAAAPPNLRTLKVLVVVMGIAIVASVIVIVVAISNRLEQAEQAGGQPAATHTTAAAQARQDPAPAPLPMAPPSAAPLKALGELSIAMPEGCVIAEASAAAGRLIVRLDGMAARGCQQVVLIDLATGDTLGRVTAVPTP